jgi:hypothetical protein
VPGAARVALKVNIVTHTVARVGNEVIRTLDFAYEACLRRRMTRPAVPNRPARIVHCFKFTKSIIFQLTGWLISKFLEYQGLVRLDFFPNHLCPENKEKKI